LKYIQLATYNLEKCEQEDIQSLETIDKIGIGIKAKIEKRE